MDAHHRLDAVKGFQDFVKQGWTENQESTAPQIPADGTVQRQEKLAELFHRVVVHRLPECNDPLYCGDGPRVDDQELRIASFEVQEQTSGPKRG